MAIPRRRNEPKPDTHQGRNPIELRLRVVEWTKMAAGELRPHPDNWRVHNDKQKRAFRAVCESQGFVGGVLAFRDDTVEGAPLTLLDGHLRQEQLDPQAIIWVGITDLSRAEADFVLTTFDSITGMAETDRDALGRLMQGIQSADAEAARLLSTIAREERVIFPEESPPDWFVNKAPKNAQTPGPQLSPDLEYRILIVCRDEEHQIEMMNELAERNIQCQPLIS